MKRILHVISCLERGGTETFIMNNYRILDRGRYQFDFLVFTDRIDENYRKEIETLGGRIFISGIPSLVNLNKFITKVVAIMKNEGPYHAVHCHVNIQNGIALKAGFQAGIPLRISHSHATSGRVNKICIKKLGEVYKSYLIRKYANKRLACSNDAGVYLYGDNKNCSFTVIPNGINIDRFLVRDTAAVQSLKYEFLLPEDEDIIILGNITRFEDNKNPLFTIRVFHELHRRIPKSVLLMGGSDGGKLEQTKNLVKELDLSSSVRFIGSRKDMAECLDLINIFLFPSKYEGLGIVLLEAQASGCFCVASTGVSKEADVVSGSTIYLTLDKKPDFWAETIINLYNRWKKPSNEMILNCFETTNYTIEKAHKKLMEVYNG